MLGHIFKDSEGIYAYQYNIAIMWPKCAWLQSWVHFSITKIKPLKRGAILLKHDHTSSVHWTAYVKDELKWPETWGYCTFQILNGIFKAPKWVFWNHKMLHLRIRTFSHLLFDKNCSSMWLIWASCCKKESILCVCCIIFAGWVCLKVTQTMKIPVCVHNSWCPVI